MRQTKVIPFDINLISSENVFTRDGKRVRILCTDRHNNCNLPILALITDNDGEELGLLYDNDGKYNGNPNNSSLDLVIHKEVIIDLHFEPFQRVLVRHGINGIWRPAIYSHKSEQLNENDETIEVHYVIGDRRSYCNILPYDDNFKQLINTSNNPNF